MALYLNGVLQTDIGGDLDVTGDVTIDGDITLTNGATFSTTNNGDIDLATNGTGLVTIGGQTSDHSLGAAGDFITNRLECNGVAYFDSGIVMGDNDSILIGAGSDSQLIYRTTHNPNALVLGVPSTSNALLICEKADVNYTFNQPYRDDPAVIVQSRNQVTNQYIEICHNGTNPVVAAGTGELIVPAYTVHVPVTAQALALGPTAPSNVIQDQAAGLEFDAAAERAYASFEIPSNWDGASNFTFEIHWASEAGDAIADTETVKWDITYRSVAHGEATDNGTAATGTVTYTQSGAGTDSETIESEITLPYNTGNQPLAANDILFIEIARDTATDTYSGGAIVTLVDVEYTANKV